MTVREDSRRRYTSLLAWGSWMMAITLVVILTYFNLTNPLPHLPNTFQRISGLFIILFMGSGIAAGTSLSRMKLARTISRVFEEGYRLAEEQQKIEGGGKHRAP